MAVTHPLRAMRVSPIEHVDATDLHLIMQPSADDKRLSAFGIQHEIPDASYVAITRNNTLAALAVLVAGRPPNHPGSPFDQGTWVRTYFAESDDLAVTLLHHVRVITQGRVFHYLRYDDKEGFKKLSRAGYRLCGVATKGWRVWTGTPDPDADPVADGD